MDYIPKWKLFHIQYLGITVAIPYDCTRYKQSGTKPNLVAKILATNFGCLFCNIGNVFKNVFNVYLIIMW